MFGNSSFDLLSAISCIISIDTIWKLITNWRSFCDDSVTAKDRFLIQRTATFILIPIGVFFHELGHALATWQVGGKVVEFQWRIFWGYVVPVGDFSPEEFWWIAFSGNLVSIALGLLALIAIFFVKKTVWKELLYTFAIVELIYSLIFYPIFSFTAFRGDWLTIYNLTIQPYAQITLFVHLLLLLGLWQANKNQWLLKFLNIPSLQTRNTGTNIILETERLIIREFTPSDVEALSQILAKPEVMLFSPTGTLSPEQTSLKIQSFIDSYQNYGYGKWAVIYRLTGQLIGYCGIAVEEIEGKQENELGYRFDSEFWGQGLATEAAMECLKYGLEKLRLKYLLGIVEPENRASVGVLVKIGMEFVKETVWCDKIVHVYIKSAGNG